jgi:anaerobic selenocysteine-containing dehydrogenase
MQRRDFIKISAITGATAALDGCGQPDVQLIRFIPEEELTPGVATWKPSICTLCPVGCGTLVKVMEGDAEVIRNGQLGLIKMGLAKKIEGNPNHPTSQGKLCPRGQAMLQVTYHPDRIKSPLKRTGPRGSGQFQEISWDEAINELVSQLRALQESRQELALRFLSRPLRDQRHDLIELLFSLFRNPGALVEFEPFEEAALCHADVYSFGYGRMPTFNLANSDYVVAFGADFLGT